MGLGHVLLNDQRTAFGNLAPLVHNLKRTQYKAIKEKHLPKNTVQHILGLYQILVKCLFLASEYSNVPAYYVNGKNYGVIN